MVDMRRNLILFLFLIVIVTYIQYTFKDQAAEEQLIPSKVHSIELKSVKIQFNQSVAYFPDDLMPLDTHKIMQLLTYLKNLKIVVTEKTSHYSLADINTMFEAPINLKVNNIQYEIGALQIATGRIPVRRSDHGEKIFWIIDDNSVMAQYDSESDAFSKRYHQLKGILGNHKSSLFQAAILQHWEMLNWKSIHYASVNFSSNIIIDQSIQTLLGLQQTMSFDTDVLEQWFAALSELKAITYFKQELFTAAPAFKIEFKSEQSNKWIEGHINLQGKPGYFLRISDQAFIYQISQQDWQLFSLNMFSFQSRSVLKNRPHDAIIMNKSHMDQNELKLLHTFLMTELAQSLSTTRPNFKTNLSLQIGNHKAELLVEGDKFVMHWADSPLYYFYQSADIGRILSKQQKKSHP
jgi:hypothetical protein